RSRASDQTRAKEKKILISVTYRRTFMTDAASHRPSESRAFEPRCGVVAGRIVGVRGGSTIGECIGCFRAAGFSVRGTGATTQTSRAGRRRQSKFYCPAVTDGN